MGMSERFDDIIAGLVSKIARLRFNGPPKTALRNAASKSDNIVEAQNVFEVELLQGIFKGLGRTAIFGRDAGFMLGDRDPGKHCTVHPEEGDKISARVDDGDIHRTAFLVRICILPRRPRGCGAIADAHGTNTSDEYLTIGSIAVAETVRNDV